jgi:biopolymer transport protein TolR
MLFNRDSKSLSATHSLTKYKMIADINVVPYVDVLLVVLAIFVITAPLMAHGVLVKLPKGGAEVLPSNDLPLTVTIDRQGDLRMNQGRGNDARIDDAALSRLAAMTLGRRPRTPVILRADEKTEYGRIIQIMALLKSAGAPSIGLMTADARR